MRDGIIILNKSSGMSSQQAVSRLKRLCNIKKAGHTGTLDPLADGLLILCTGGATKLADEFLNSDKTYSATLEFGYETDTYDILGRVTQVTESIPTLEEIEKVLPSFLGNIEQIPPKFSAINISGKRAYQRALKGESFEMPKRAVEIKYIKILSFKDNVLKIETKVSKGTYIRSLIRDLAIVLNSLATLSSLTRLSYSKYTLEDAYSLDEIEACLKESDFSFLKKIEDFEFETIDLNEREMHLFKNGLTFISHKEDKIYKAYFNNDFVGLVKIVNERAKFYKYKNQ